MNIPYGSGINWNEDPPYKAGDRIKSTYWPNNTWYGTITFAQNGLNNWYGDYELLHITWDGGGRDILHTRDALHLGTIERIGS